jgi:hypothetical protein
VLATLGLRAFLVPIYDRLIRHTILVVQDLRAHLILHVYDTDRLGTTNLQYLRERFPNTCILVAVHLHRVDKGDFRLGARAKWLDNRCVTLVTI